MFTSVFNVSIKNFMKYRLTQNKPHCDISSFHFLRIFLNCKETLWTLCIIKVKIKSSNGGKKCKILLM